MSPDTPRKLAVPVKFMSRNGSLRIRLKSPIKREVAGNIFREPGMTADFHNHSFVTDDAEKVKMLRAMLRDPQRAGYWNRLFTEMPSSETIKKMEEATRDIQKKIDDAKLKATSAEEVKHFESFEKFRKEQQKTQGRVVEGMRGLHNG